MAEGNDPTDEAADDVFAAAEAHGEGFFGEHLDNDDDDFEFDDDGREVVKGKTTEHTADDGDNTAKKLSFASPPTTGGTSRPIRGTAAVTPTNALTTLANAAAAAPHATTGGQGSTRGTPPHGTTAGTTTTASGGAGGTPNATAAAQAARNHIAGQTPADLHGLRGVFARRLQFSLEERKQALIRDCAIQMGHNGDAGAISAYKNWVLGSMGLQAHAWIEQGTHHIQVVHSINGYTEIAGLPTLRGQQIGFVGDRTESPMRMEPYTIKMADQLAWNWVEVTFVNDGIELERACGAGGTGFWSPADRTMEETQELPRMLLLGDEMADFCAQAPRTAAELRGEYARLVSEGWLTEEQCLLQMDWCVASHQHKDGHQGQGLLAFKMSGANCSCPVWNAWKERRLNVTLGKLPETSSSQTSTFLQCLQDTVIKCNDHIFATWYDKNGKASAKYSFTEMWEEAGEIAYFLRVVEKLNKGDRVVLCYSFGLQFFAAFLGCLRAGVTAVLVYPPQPSKLAKSLPKMTSVTTDCDAKIILVNADIKYVRAYDQYNPLSKSRHLWPTKIKFVDVHSEIKQRLTAMNMFSKKSKVFDDDSITENDIAFLQYTSGSTGSPKGVMVIFGALQANINAIINGANKECDKVNFPRDDVVTLSWVPQYHDMGLIGACIAPFAAGWRCNMFSPIDFVQNPLLWIDLMSRLQVNWSLAPDFGYNLAARKFLDAKRLGGEPIKNLDLSSIVCLQSGAEPINSATKQLFDEAFSGYGLTDSWFSAIYGMAEMVVHISYVHEFKQSNRVSSNGLPLVAVAHRSNLSKGQILKIVCPESHHELDDGEVGELWISGPSVTAGYFNKAQLTKEVFHAKIQIGGSADNSNSFLRTGDLAFFEDDYIYICGRQKDLIIVNGVNYYPQDIEFAAQNASDAVRPGCVAAFSSNDGNGKVEIVLEIRKSHEKDAANVLAQIYNSIVQEIGITPTRLVAIKQRTIHKTTSGKIQRNANHKALNERKLSVIYEYKTASHVLKQLNNELNATRQRSDSALNKKMDFDSDVLVVGAGIVGLCFARDIAALGYQVTVVEKSNKVGGTWASNDYPGLRLHQPGCSYRCISLAPTWTKDHQHEEFYRPTRDEVFDYCQQLAQHENITILLKTSCSYSEYKATGTMSVIVHIEGKKHKTRYLFAATGCYRSNCGQPVLPLPPLTRNDEEENSFGPLMIHSSQLNGINLEEFKKTRGLKVIFGSGKAAIDLLQILDPSDSVLWAHRGHTLFLDRSFVESMYEDDGLRFSSRMFEVVSERGRYSLSCRGPLTRRRIQFGGGVCGQEEISHADSFDQFPLDCLEKLSGDCIRLKANEGKRPNIDLTTGDSIIFCTGQQNEIWKPPSLENVFAQVAPFTLNSAPLNTILPLCVALDTMRGRPLSAIDKEVIKNTLDSLHELVLGKCPREIDLYTCEGLQPLRRHFLKGVVSDIAYMSQWQNDWYGRDMPVAHVLDIMRHGIDKGAGAEPTDDFDRILGSFFGGHYDASSSWDELGMSSVMSIQIRDALLDFFSVTLSPDSFNLYPTPKDLKKHMLGNQGAPLEVSLPPLTEIKSKQLTWFVLGLIQVTCSLFLLFLFASPIATIWFYGNLFANGDISLARSLVIPLAVPTWMLWFSLYVILLKWTVIGSYKEGIVSIPSTAFLRWWFVDRAVSLWELWVGNYVKDTPLINTFYFLMGAKIHRSARINSFIREFDLVDIGQDALLQYAIRCHRFGPWSERLAPTIRFRPISIGSQSTVKSLVSLGSSVGDGVFVENLSMMVEGSCAPSRTCIVGNPAFASDTLPPLAEFRHPWWKLGIWKVLWLGFELYLTFSMIFLGYRLWGRYLAWDWRYTTLFTGFLLLSLWLFVMSAMSSIIIKWIFIGKRKPGPFTDTLWKTILGWTSDWHYGNLFKASIMFPISFNSGIWNVILMMHGMDIDLKSKVSAQNYQPSFMDLVKIRKSFVSNASFSSCRGGRSYQISIIESSIGLGANVGPACDIAINRAIVSPLVHVENSLLGENVPGSYIGSHRQLWDEILFTGLCFILLGAVFTSLIPSFELWVNIAQPNSVWTIVLALVCIFVVQTATWIALLRAMEFVALTLSREDKTAPRWSLIYRIYLSVGFIHQELSFVHLLYGSSAYNFVMRILGSKFEGQALLFPQRFYDYSFLKFSNKAIVDLAGVTGHYGVNEHVTIGPCEVAGVVHPANYVANASLAGQQDTGPMRSFVGTYKASEMSGIPETLP